MQGAQGLLLARKKVFELQRKIKDAYIFDDFQELGALIAELLQIANTLPNGEFAQAVKAYYQNVNKILTQRQLLSSFMSQITEIFRAPKMAPEPQAEDTLRLQILEEEFQNAFADQNFRACLEKLSYIIGIAQKLNLQDKIAHYSELREPFEIAAQQQPDMVPQPQSPPPGPPPTPVQSSPLAAKPPITASPLRPPVPPEIQQKIAQLKKKAAEFEEQLQFPQAKAVYQEIVHIASNAQDSLTVTFSEDRTTQIGLWEEEIAHSDFSKFEIPPFRLVNRARFDCLEAFSDKHVAEKKMADLITLGVQKDTIKVLTVVRSKYKGKAPYNKSGETFVLYIRRTLE